MHFRSQRNHEVDLNITPLIDVVFLLLIFFMVSTTFDHESEMNITLPKASREVIAIRAEVINISIDNQSRIYVNEVELPNIQISTIKEAIYNASNGVEDIPIIISADQETPYQMVIRSMDAARQLGLVKITFATGINDDDY